jgi:hypothetical protein
LPLPPPRSAGGTASPAAVLVGLAMLVAAISNTVARSLTLAGSVSPAKRQE